MLRRPMTKPEPSQPHPLGAPPRYTRTIGSCRIAQGPPDIVGAWRGLALLNSTQNRGLDVSRNERDPGVAKYGPMVAGDHNWLDPTGRKLPPSQFLVEESSRRLARATDYHHATGKWLWLVALHHAVKILEQHMIVAFRR